MIIRSILICTMLLASVFAHADPEPSTRPARSAAECDRSIFEKALAFPAPVSDGGTLFRVMCSNEDEYLKPFKNNCPVGFIFDAKYALCLSTKGPVKRRTVSLMGNHCPIITFGSSYPSQPKALEQKKILSNLREANMSGNEDELHLPTAFTSADTGCRYNLDAISDGENYVDLNSSTCKTGWMPAGQPRGNFCEYVGPATKAISGLSCSEPIRVVEPASHILSPTPGRRIGIVQGRTVYAYMSACNTETGVEPKTVVCALPSFSRARINQFISQLKAGIARSCAESVPFIRVPFSGGLIQAKCENDRSAEAAKWIRVTNFNDPDQRQKLREQVLDLAGLYQPTVDLRVSDEDLSKSDCSITR